MKIKDVLGLVEKEMELVTDLTPPPNTPEIGPNDKLVGHLSDELKKLHLVREKYHKQALQHALKYMMNTDKSELESGDKIHEIHRIAVVTYERPKRMGGELR